MVRAGVKIGCAGKKELLQVAGFENLEIALGCKICCETCRSRWRAGNMRNNGNGKEGQGARSYTKSRTRRYEARR